MIIIKGPPAGYDMMTVREKGNRLESSPKDLGRREGMRAREAGMTRKDDGIREFRF